MACGRNTQPGSERFDGELKLTGNRFHNQRVMIAAFLRPRRSMATSILLTAAQKHRARSREYLNARSPLLVCQGSFRNTPPLVPRGSREQFVRVAGWVLQIMNRIRELTTIESNTVSGNARIAAGNSIS